MPPNIRPAPDPMCPTPDPPIQLPVLHAPIRLECVEGWDNAVRLFFDFLFRPLRAAILCGLPHPPNPLIPLLPHLLLPWTISRGAPPVLRGLEGEGGLFKRLVEFSLLFFFVDFLVLCCLLLLVLPPPDD